jgi:hypothetical protein
MEKPALAHLFTSPVVSKMSLQISDFAKRVPASVVSILAVMNSRKDHVWREVEKQPSDVASCRSLEPGGLLCLLVTTLRCNSSRRCPYDHAKFEWRLASRLGPVEATRSSDFMSFKRSTMIV